MTVQKMYPGLDIKADEVFVSDGSKCDIGKWNRDILYYGCSIETFIPVV